jgi:glycerophosphoryl diester phosphodiesterase
MPHRGNESAPATTGKRLVAIGVSFTLVLCILFADATRAAEVGQIEVQGHRGARGLFPENTLEGFTGALRIGVDVLELDVGLSKDNAVVVCHDAKLNPQLTRDLDGRWLQGPRPTLRDLSFAEIRRFNVGRAHPSSEVAKRFPHQQIFAHAHIPALREIFALAARAQANAVQFNIELKIRPNTTQPAGSNVYASPQVFADAVAREIEAAEAIARVTIQSFDWHALTAMKLRLPNIRLAALTTQQPWFDNVQLGQSGPSPWTAGLDVDDFGGSVPHLVSALGATVWSPYWRDLTPAKLRAAHELGLRVSVWTVNTRSHMRKMIELGVDSIITDYPNRLRAELAARELPLPPPVDF